MEQKRAERLLPIGDSTAWQRPKGEWWVRLGVFTLLAFLYLPNLGSFGLWDPWETHYGEVTRNMVESYDWVSPWWGYRGKIGSEGVQGSYFYSKPILIFWAEAASVRLIGFSEWAIRLPMALFALLSAFLAYYVIAKIWNRKAGLLACLVIATSPEFFLLARQAQTDMIFVAPLTVAMLYLLLAFFGPDESNSSGKSFAAKYLFNLGVFLACTVPQFIVIGTDLRDDRTFENLPTFSRWMALIKLNGVYHALIYGVLTLVFLVWFCGPVVWRLVRRRPIDGDMRDLWLRRGYVLIFVVMCSMATLGKGLLGFMLPGAIAFAFMVLTNNWKLLKAFDLPRSILAFLLSALPWYVAMFAKHGNAFYSRFFVHDHFNRLGTGVHQIDSGTFEHFLKWLGVGMYPWVAFVPLAIIVLMKIRLSLKTRENQYNLMVFLWFFISYTLFTLAKTKFHHYIFPALPPMGLIIGKALADYLGHRGYLMRVASVLALGLFVGVTYNLSQDEQLLRNLFTYKYDRTLPTHKPIDSEAPSTDDPGPKCGPGVGDCGPLEECSPEGTCTVDWGHSQFYEHSTATVRWALNQDFLLYDNFVLFLGILGAAAIALLLFRRLRTAAIAGLLLLGVCQTAWGLSYYLPSFSPHWSQKNVFEDYYSLCGDRLQHVETEAYEPLIKKMGLDSLYDYFRATTKRVCPYNITSWLIVWRGETYYSYNELMPLEKKNNQLKPYLEGINPVLMDLPESCPVRKILCPRKFFVFMENRKSNTASSVASGVNAEVKKIQRDATSAAAGAYADVETFVAQQVSNENDFFTLFEATPQYKKGAAQCSCARAELP
jgi:4-amino-4-deoxy-L-arabinose transferase-like glycosyltransferase